MEIKDILSKLGIDLTNPEAKRGALEAIDAILASRQPVDAGDLGGGGAGGGEEKEIELDPDLLQPSIKQQQNGGSSDDDIEIEDEENILDQIKHKESEDDVENKNSNDNNSDSDSKSDNKQNSKENSDENNQADKDNKDQQDKDSKNNKDDAQNQADRDDKNNNKDKVNSDDDNDFVDGEEDENGNVDFGDGGSDDDVDSDDHDLVDGDSDGDGEDFDDDAEGDFGDDGDFGDSGDNSVDGDDFDFDDEFGDGDDNNENEPEDESDGDDDFDFDEDDLVDDEIKDSTEDEAEKTKNNARKIKRERTLAAARNALASAQARKVSPALIHELERSIEALEALVEAVAKSLKDISDEEFNLMINRVLDAIDACGNSGLTYKSEDERQAQAKEIKADLAKSETQNELSAEDAAKIRAETQAIKARERETAKYAQRSNRSFKGFQEFLNSLYRAIALQVSNEETRDDSWSAINRRYSGTGILQPGKKFNDLPNNKIPVIDFYFDCSSSWNVHDIEIGKKAVAALADLEEKGKIKVNLFYFADEVSTSYSEVAGGWTSAWNHIVKNVIATQANNVVIMTDRDMESQGMNEAGVQGFLKYTVPGYVWYLWKNGNNAQRLPRDLNGRGGVQQFSFSANDV